LIEGQFEPEDDEDGACCDGGVGWRFLASLQHGTTCETRAFSGLAGEVKDRSLGFGRSPQQVESSAAAGECLPQSCHKKIAPPASGGAIQECLI